jgi:hypothetical protein
MKTAWKYLLAFAVATSGLSAVAKAQTSEFGAGSSAMFLQLGEAANTLEGTNSCVWTNATAVSAHDTSVTPNAVDTGSAWVIWKGVGGSSSCSSVASGSTIYSYLSTDSVVGDRCLFNSTCSIVNVNGPEPAAGAGLLNSVDPTVIEVTPGTMLPSAVLTAVNGHPNYSGTDIRPEDAEFAITRAVAPCGTQLTQFAGGSGTATQYEGLGYTPSVTPNNVITGTVSGTFFVVPFSLPSTGFTVTPLGATPIVVVANGDATTNNGFGDPNIKNLNRSTLALYLDGSIGSTADALTPGTTAVAAVGTTVWLREPLSGTYNTMEYNVPNSTPLQTSQDVGVNQVAFTSTSVPFNKNCNGAVPFWNGATMETLVPSAIGGTLPTRKRAIGTGSELTMVRTTSDSLGYAFWSASNFAGYTPTGAPHAKYLSVDGVDPLGTGTEGVAGTGIPTSATGGTPLSNVTLAHVADGTYPIWSLIRLVNVGESAPAALTSLANAAQSAISAAHPDFVPFTAGLSSDPTFTPGLQVERAHFVPPAIAASGAIVPENGACGLFRGAAEVGGDVGGVVIPCVVDESYRTDTGVTFTGTATPSSTRRQ